MSEPIQAIATNNYLLATPIGSGYMETSALEYDGDKISGYAGSAFKAGDEFPQSATDAIGYVTATSANIDATIDNVSANSGAWGGSALPISAGPGIKFELDNGTLVASNDETVLWEGFKTDIPNTGETTYTLSELATNFETIRIEYVLQNNTLTVGDLSNKGAGTVFYEIGSSFSRYITYIHCVMNGNNSTTAFSLYDIDTNIYNMDNLTWNVKSVLRGQTNNGVWFHITKIVGINRKN